jgi:5-methyltetrahydropteroyltriglutamate--homocysteine methyltransferase
MKTYAYGLPRIGKKREYKKVIESYWKGEAEETAVLSVLSGIELDNIRAYQNNVDMFPNGEMSLYDPMLDTAILCGIYDPEDMEQYYDLCRGASALEMTKWFNTNYHYLVTDFGGQKSPIFRFNRNNLASKFKKCSFPQLIGPFTFLKLSKGIKKGAFENSLLSIAEIYKEILKGQKRAQIDEPAFVMDLDEKEISLIKQVYRKIAESGCEISLMTYYDEVDFIDDLFSLPVSAIGLDLVRGGKTIEKISKNGFPQDKLLIAGLIDGRNIWKNDVESSVLKLKRLSKKVKNLAVSNAAPLYHLPVSVSEETALPDELKKRLSFAEEKLAEIRMAAECFEGKGLPGHDHDPMYGRDENVKKITASLKESDFIKPFPLEDRRIIHKKELRLPIFPTTTIGSYPQTEEVRKKRAAFRNGTLSAEEYRKYIHGEIDKLIAFQEALGLDVLVHGEFERTDMVEFFAQRLEGIATTSSGWVLSYGTRAYRPPIIFGDVSRAEPMTTDEIFYAQSKTKKPVKGMLTGAVTIIAWSFCREDIHVSDIAYQISLALKDEIKDYETNGIKIVQVDEAAFKEKCPVKKRDWPSYFDWAVKSFNLATNTSKNTQIHTHMCYSEFGEIIEYINQMDFDVISIEASRSKGDIIAHFENIGFKRQIGLGIWDIHSPHVPDIREMKDIVQRSLKKIPKENFWLNPDCGLKTRDWEETSAALKNMMKVANKLREKIREIC